MGTIITNKVDLALHGYYQDFLGRVGIATGVHMAFLRRLPVSTRLIGKFIHQSTGQEYYDSVRKSLFSWEGDLGDVVLSTTVYLYV